MRGVFAAEIKVTRLGEATGAEISGVDLKRRVEPSAFRQIMDTWIEYLVLRFRNQGDLTTQQFVNFSKLFGHLDRAPITTTETGRPYISEYPEITAISNIVVDGKPIGGLGAYEAEWHTDMSYNEETPSASLLYSIEIPPSGGDTWFANMYLAYDSLPKAMKQRIANLRCVHDASRNSAGMLRKGFKEVTDPRDTVGAVHPVVRTHPLTKRKALFLGRRRNAYISGLSLGESEALLGELWAHAIKPEFTWVQKWRVDDILVWDNRCTMHRRDAFNPNTRRLMHRTQIRGDRPC